MNCPQCGHPTNDHTSYFEEGGCYTDGCMCMLSSIEVMRNAWKAEAMAARAMQEAVGDFGLYIQRKAEWEAARVVDNPKDGA